MSKWEIVHLTVLSLRNYTWKAAEQNDEDIEIKLTNQERHARDEGKPKNFAEGIKSYRLEEVLN